MADLPVAALKAELFKALAHPVRVRALEQLVQGERSVGDLADSIDAELTQLSQQLAVLRRAGVVVTRRDGNTIYYSVRDPRIAELLAVARQLLLSNLQDTTELLATLEREHAASEAATGTEVR
ncbi:metalloregulator ArsR/SmtB family transcription factor [Cryobacterium sp. BB307]|uniref:ArsR/SmtB family transcription factor n=1 Tax=Cryobacterium sp. BB307 TaxID=2716317 RepID=UPI0014486E68|nr:metalloregulator ArsR/SmtB family transcription factor [Cryobacterium sp. BB307]